MYIPTHAGWWENWKRIFYVISFYLHTHLLNIFTWLCILDTQNTYKVYIFTFTSKHICIWGNVFSDKFYWCDLQLKTVSLVIDGTDLEDWEATCNTALRTLHTNPDRLWVFFIDLNVWPSGLPAESIFWHLSSSIFFFPLIFGAPIISPSSHYIS